MLAQRFYDAETVARLPDGLDGADRAIMAFAEKVVDDATSIAEYAVGVLPDASFADLRAVLREAVTVGRPIQSR